LQGGEKSLKNKEAAMERKPLVSVTKKDFKIQTLKGSGPGGQHRNKTETGVRITHPESGAIGLATDSKSQSANKKAAFQRLVATPVFQLWIKKKSWEAMGQQSLDERVEEAMQPQNLKWEVQDANGNWTQDSSPAQAKP
jgi:protein subunit release factor B